MCEKISQRKPNRREVMLNLTFIIMSMGYFYTFNILVWFVFVDHKAQVGYIHLFLHIFVTIFNLCGYSIQYIYCGL